MGSFKNLVIASVLAMVAPACGIFGSGESEPTPAPPGEAAPPPPAPNTGNGPPAPPPPAVDGVALVGVFVSASKGVDQNDGAVARPLKTLAKAMLVAKEKNLPVIACAETYNEALVLVNGVTLYGYFDCTNPDWKRGEKHAAIASPSSPAVLADKLDLKARFEGFDIYAPDIGGVAAADKVARSSIAMLVKGTKGLEIAEVHLRAGNAEGGGDGVDTAEVNTETAPTSPTPSQQFLGCPFGFAQCAMMSYAPPPLRENTPITCKYGAPGGPGGAGGDGALWVDGQRKTAIGHDFTGKPFFALPQTAAGGAPAQTYAPETSDGRNGAKGESGAAGTNGGWSLDAEGGFVPGNGTAGVVGGPGQGGGGGAGNFVWRSEAGGTLPVPTTGYAWAGTGGAGGTGGCGGLPGTPGRGAGASIGLLVVASEISVKTSRIEARAGGAAGKGALGQIGNNGYLGGFPLFAPNDRRLGAPGGDGGPGGDAGPSGHGSPGPSIALAYKGQRPNVDASSVTLTPGTPGTGQSALARPGSIVAAVSGEAKAEHVF